jgi:hypothetical protein
MQAVNTGSQGTQPKQGAKATNRRQTWLQRARQGSLALESKARRQEGSETGQCRKKQAGRQLCSAVNSKAGRQQVGKYRRGRQGRQAAGKGSERKARQVGRKATRESGNGARKAGWKAVNRERQEARRQAVRHKWRASEGKASMQTGQGNSGNQ